MKILCGKVSVPLLLKPHVYIDGQRRGYATTGRPSVIPLTPFEQYRVVIKPSGSGFYDFNERERQVTLYPGNVVTLEYDATPLQLVFGRILLHGEPVIGSRILGGLQQSYSDEYGMFQIETRSNIKQLQVQLNSGEVCNLPMPAGTNNPIIRMGQVELASLSCEFVEQKLR